MGRNKIVIPTEELTEALKTFDTQSEIADHFGVSQGTISNKISENPELGASAISKTERDPRIERPEYSYEETKEILLDKEDETAESVGYTEVDIEIETDLPIRILPLADWHIGARHVSYNRLLKCIDLISNDPQTFTTLNGDLIDNYNTSAYKSGQIEQQIKIQDQKIHAESLVKKLTPSTLSILNGCHDEWSYFNDGFDFARYLSQHSKGYYMGHNGKINLKVGDITYRLYVTHNTRYHSSLNPGHGLGRSFKEITEFDIGIGAHYHTPHFEKRIIRDQEVCLMYCGPFKGQGRHSSKGEYGLPYEITPAVVLYPHERKIMGDIDYKRVDKYL